jgi:hypothetical protein
MTVPDFLGRRSTSRRDIFRTGSRDYYIADINVRHKFPRFRVFDLIGAANVTKIVFIAVATRSFIDQPKSELNFTAGAQIRWQLNSEPRRLRPTFRVCDIALPNNRVVHQQLFEPMTNEIALAKPTVVLKTCVLAVVIVSHVKMDFERPRRLLRQLNFTRNATTRVSGTLLPRMVKHEKVSAVDPTGVLSGS